MASELTIASETLSARVSARGAELTSLDHVRHGNLLWRGDPAWWPEHSPILFPVVGRCRDDRIRVGDRSFPMPLHGFARTSAFSVVEAGADHCRLRLADSSLTREHYPFAFSLDLDYRVEGATLRAGATITNPGDVVLPASFGFHPGFRWPLSPDVRKEDHVLWFADDDRIEVHRPRSGLIRRDGTSLDLAGGGLPLSESLFAEGAMVLASLRSRRLRFVAGSSGLSLDLETSGLPSLGLWMKPGADFLCIEPWAGHGDPEGFDGELADKPGMLAIEPGGRVRFDMRIEVAERS